MCALHICVRIFLRRTYTFMRDIRKCLALRALCCMLCVHCVAYIALRALPYVRGLETSCSGRLHQFKVLSGMSHRRRSRCQECTIANNSALQTVCSALLSIIVHSRQRDLCRSDVPDRPESMQATCLMHGLLSLRVGVAMAIY